MSSSFSKKTKPRYYTAGRGHTDQLLDSLDLISDIIWVSVQFEQHWPPTGVSHSGLTWRNPVVWIRTPKRFAQQWSRLLYVYCFRLCAQRVLLVRYRHWSKQMMLSSIPIEVFLKILRLACAPSNGPRVGRIHVNLIAVTVSHVCRAWKDLAISDP